MLFVHLGTLALTFLVILYSDHEAFQYITGKQPVLDRKKTMFLHTLVWIGLLGMIGSGLWMAWPNLGVLFSVTGFQIKMAFVALLVVNAIFIGYLMDIAFEKPFKELSKGKQLILLFSGAVSTVGWLGAALSAMLTFGNIFSWLGISF